MAVQQVQNLPPQFIQDIGKDLATQITAQTAIPIVTSGIAGIQQQPGESADQFKARQDAATQFGIRQQSLQGLAPQVAQQDALQTQAQTLAQQGVGSFQPFLTQAQQAADRAFTQGGQLAAAQSGLGAAQMGLSNFQRAGLGADVGALGQLGSLRQGQSQSLLSADQQAAQTAAYEPYGRLSQYGQGLTGLSGGVAGPQYAPQQPVSPLSSAIGTALGVGGLYGKIFGFPADRV